MKRLAFAGLTLIALTAPAMAQEYYIVREPDTEECTVVETRPADGAAIVIGDTVFETRSAAEAQVEVLCTDTDGATVIEEEPADGVVVVE
jgi:hypothetical protein